LSLAGSIDTVRVINNCGFAVSLTASAGHVITVTKPAATRFMIHLPLHYKSLSLQIEGTV